jgi:ParB family chromosome partitioning protein
VKLKGLGRGLDALLDKDGEGGPVSERQATLRIDQLQRGRYQPRTKMDDSSLEELAASIKTQGLMQPILARPIGNNRYEIIAGERRWRAAKIAGLAEVPALVRDVPDSSALAMALVENIQRENLNPLEEAGGVQRLIGEFKLTHQEAAEAIGRSRTATTNLLRLLNLQKAVQALVFDGKLEMGHARALLALNGRQQESAAKRIADQALSVRQTEHLVNALLHPTVKAKRRPGTDRDIARLEEELSEEIGTKIEIKPSKKGAGKLVISYSSHDHLDDLLSKFRRKRSIS